MAEASEVQKLRAQADQQMACARKALTSGFSNDRHKAVVQALDAVRLEIRASSVKQG